jgi:peptidoglycan/LPS O-acetylase OafA/YrhL
MKSFPNNLTSAKPTTSSSITPHGPGSTASSPENFVGASFLALPGSYPSLRSGTLSAFYYFQPAAWQRLTRHGNRLLLIALALVAGAWLIAHDDNQYKMQGAIFGYPAISIAYGALVLAALSPTSLLYRYSSKITRFIATLSYSIYLTHKQLIHLTHEALHHYNIGHDSYLSLWISIAVALLGGWLLHLFIEKPFLRLRDKWLARKHASPLPAPSPQP